MVTALLETSSELIGRHLTVGCSTGYMVEDRGDWPALVSTCAATSLAAAELSALSEDELPGSANISGGAPALPFDYISVHAPSKSLRASEPQRVDMLIALPTRVGAVVVHPDTLQDLTNWARLGSRLVLENMDSRKPGGRTTQELSPIFEALPRPGLASISPAPKEIDPDLHEAHRLLDRFGDRLRHVHLSSLDADNHHVSLTPADEELFASTLERCGDVPWILEAPPARGSPRRLEDFLDAYGPNAQHLRDARQLTASSLATKRDQLAQIALPPDASIVLFGSRPRN